MTYSIDPEAGRIRISGSGVVTDDDVVECIGSLRADPKLEPGMSTLSDMRGVEVAVSSKGIARMLQVMESTASRRGKAKAAIVVDSDLAFGMGRMVELRADGRLDPNFRIFRDMDEARRWLGGEQADSAR